MSAKLKAPKMTKIPVPPHPMQVKDRPTEYADTWISTPLLDRLMKDRAFSIYWNDKGGYSIQEECDQYFGSDLTPDELRQLGHDLIRIADQTPNKEK